MKNQYGHKRASMYERIGVNFAGGNNIFYYVKFTATLGLFC